MTQSIDVMGSIIFVALLGRCHAVDQNLRIDFSQTREGLWARDIAPQQASAVWLRVLTTTQSECRQALILELLPDGLSQIAVPDDEYTRLFC